MALQLDPVDRARRSPVALAQLNAAGTVQPYQMWSWVALLQRYLIGVAAGRIQRLAVFIPPQSGKSTLIARTFSAWYLGNWPDRHVILASHAWSLARRHGFGARELLMTHGPSVFGVTIDERLSAAGEWAIKDHEGSMFSVGVGGGTTGRPSHLFIIDDPHAGPVDASSVHRQKTVWDWYQTVTTTRLQPVSAQILVMTRWHDGDLGGRIFTHAEEIGQPWTMLRLPAIAEEDESLGDEVGYKWRRSEGAVLEPRRFSLATMLERKKALEPRWWQAMYQQRPRPETGDVFQRGWFRYYTTIGTEHGQTFVLDRLDEQGKVLASKRIVWAALRRFTTVDLAVSLRTSADFTVIATWGLVPSSKDLLLLDVVRARMEGPDIVPAMVSVAQRMKPSKVLVESVAFQLSIVQEAQRKGLPVVGYRPEGDKLARATFAAARMEAGAVWFPASASWLGDVEAELLAFPSGQFDDQIDVISMAVDEASGLHSGGPIRGYS